MLASLLLLTSLPSVATTTAVQIPRIQDAVDIHTATREYLEFDIAPLGSCEVPVIDSLIYRDDTARVWRHNAVSTDSNGVCTSIPRANVLEPFPLSVGGANGSISIAAVVDMATGMVVSQVGTVQNDPRTIACPLYACVFLDSASAFKTVQTRIQSSSFLAVFGSYPLLTTVVTSPWSYTSGLENDPQVAVPLPGNAWNWIDVDSRRFKMDSLIRGSIALPCLTGNVCPDLVILPTVAVPTGPVQYFYQQETDPSLGDTTLRVPSFDQDTILKIGTRLHLSGNIRNNLCSGPLVDSALYQDSLWLVATNSPTSDSLAAAFALPGFCNLSRPGAWPYRDGMVEITTTGIWVSLAELLQTTAIQAQPKVLPARASLRRLGGTVVLDLSAPATVRAIDLSGRQVLSATAFPAGRHALNLPADGSMLFVQVRSGPSTTTLPLEPMH